MAVMMGGGIGLRMAGLVPDWFVAFFYTGLGVCARRGGHHLRAALLQERPSRRAR